jgi:hypothetical protein
MKTKLLAILVISFLSLITVSGQDSTVKINPVGTWKFEAPYAPEGYSSGTLVFSLADQKTTAQMNFAGNGNKFPAEKLIISNNSLTFNVYVEGNTVAVTLKSEDQTKMSGKAVYSEGEVPLTLTKVIEAEQQKKR